MMKCLITVLFVGLCFTTKSVTASHQTLLRTNVSIIRANDKSLGNSIDHVVANKNTDAICADDLLNFAQTLIGVPYHFASSNPEYGFDCSGFVGFVFHNFNIPVPRSSADYANAGERIKLTDAKPGDVILFAGTQKRSRRIGHIGIIISNADNEIKFIHSTSGKEHGVTITTMDKTYRRRFVRVVRMLKQNIDA